MSGKQGAFPDDQVRFDVIIVIGRIGILNAVDHPLDGHIRHTGDAVLNRCQRGRQIGGDGKIVEAHNANILRNPPAQALAHPVQLGGNEIMIAEDAYRLPVLLQKLGDQTVVRPVSTGNL